VGIRSHRFRGELLHALRGVLGPVRLDREIARFALPQVVKAASQRFEEDPSGYLCACGQPGNADWTGLRFRTAADKQPPSQRIEKISPRDHRFGSPIAHGPFI